MHKALSLIDRFFSIITQGESRQNDRIKSQWQYLQNLLKTQPISYDRIQAYLNILQQQNTQNKRNNHKARRQDSMNKENQFNQNQINLMIKNIQSVAKLYEGNNQKICWLEKLVSNSSGNIGSNCRNNISNNNGSGYQKIMK